MGDRNGRWAMVFDNGKVVYAENETSPGEVSVGSEAAIRFIHAYVRRSLVPRRFLLSYEMMYLMDIAKARPCLSSM